MDEAEGGLSRSRRVRAIALGAVALLLIAGAAAVYLKVPLPRISIGSPIAGPQLTASDADNITYDFLNPDVGWAVDMRFNVPGGNGDFWIFRTTDGARHWQTQLRGKTTSSGTSQLYIFDPQHGFAFIAGPAQLYRTDDGGLHWTRVDLPSRAIADVQFVDAQHGWLFDNEGLSGRTTIYVTTDGGKTWQFRSYPPDDAFGLVPRSPSEAWLGGQGGTDGHVYWSFDGGSTWDLMPVPWKADGEGQCVAAVDLLPASDGLLASGSCGTQPLAVFSSFDVGATWTRVPTPPTGWANVTFAATFDWWTMNGSTLWKSTDAGQTWTRFSSQHDGWDYIPHPMDRMRGWAVLVHLDAPGSRSGLALTSDGGLHWTQVNAPRP